MRRIGRIGPSMDIVSTRSVAALLGVSEATVKRWADGGVLRCFRTRGGHRKFRMGDVRAFLDDAPDRAHAPGDEADGAPAAPEPPAPLGEHAQQAYTLAVSGDVDALVSLVTRARDDAASFAVTFDLLLAPALREVGTRWTQGAISVAEEHIASNTVSEALARLRPLVERAGARVASRASRERRDALCACLGEERHDLALRMVTLMLAERGYKTRLVGGHVPAVDLARLVGAERPALVALSASANADGASLRGDLAVIASAATTARARVIVGGAGFAKLDRVPSVVSRYGAIADFIE
jgi:excisionase family DNA binding protein